MKKKHISNIISWFVIIIYINILNSGCVFLSISRYVSRGWAMSVALRLGTFKALKLILPSVRSEFCLHIRILRIEIRRYAYGWGLLILFFESAAGTQRKSTKKRLIFLMKHGDNMIFKAADTLLWPPLPFQTLFYCSFLAALRCTFCAQTDHHHFLFCIHLSMR